MQRIPNDFLVNRCYYMPNSHNLQEVVIEITSQSHQVTKPNTKTGKQWTQKINASVKKLSLIDHFYFWRF